MSKDEFSEKIGRLTRSKTYLQFCKEVYGYNEYLFNMMDREQIDFVLNSIPISSEDTILDLGCGEDVIIMLKGKNAVTKRVSELPQSTKFENWCVA
jgi:hypothetical protein